MIDALSSNLSRRVLFVSLNGFVLLFIVLFVITPIWSRFSDKNQEISQTTALLAHFQSVIRNSKALTASAPLGDPFLPDGEERIVSADLQANLKAIAEAGGVRFLGIRGLKSNALPPRMIAVSLEMEGSLQAVRDVVRMIEGQMPLLFITSALLRSTPDADSGPIHAELTVLGAMRDSGSPRSGIVEPADVLPSGSAPDKEH
jgi:general secretion pathway protein M